MYKNFSQSRLPIKTRKLLILITTALTTLLLVIGLPTVTTSPVVAQSNTSLLISAAASLKEVLVEIQPLYQQSQPNVNINYNFGSSGTLQQQIEQGAPTDIFISAAKKQVDTLEQKGLLVTGSRNIIAKNRLVLIVPKNAVGINSFYSLKDAKVKKIAIGEPRSVPAGQYAQQVLEKLKIWTEVKSKLVFANNVRQVLASVESGNADTGLVYATDAKISNRVKVVVTADEKYHSPIIYPLAVVKRSKNVNAAKEFSQFLSSNQAKAVFKKYGFILP
ncbi:MULTISPECIES: molybdate ABC transporter substrate-binding protein [Aphanizomenon]|uniref:Molybdate ABC transporter substrate-binding protein n=1 Tax=Aphanizomenon flos-aquae FACHB-1249 TaxID=2692889 RepID=A0ABR8IKY1_APHFL|nr:MULTISPECIES: molybdate ABC transporter substrate-binding protein [Aphanizomenon]MBD2390573.1 molybdate ABC transporter substrate-binding protein [Aphanizomenon flos-aquae FACHB-1171]MBD2558393.1 molybdate ABC transporter substrate-binding protein [Aphanizomenon flos-aquae FACHB-1290]MBD2632637.1 molybdate ABC transporter substrate-binding protein [Aphanizomenon sp. FACHB-1399]MBD2640906.1 molybdate ABC transporter substrate-binding protein [Aphanizomenon sp. FACHB-1401]MBD2656638.1 molybda